MNLLAIDPGSTFSGYVSYDTETNKVLQFGKERNKFIIKLIESHKSWTIIEKPDFISKGAGKEVIDTIFWAGRFFQCAKLPMEFGRNEVKKTYELKNDKQVRDFIKERYNVVLKADSWQAFLLVHHYLTQITT